MPGEWTRKSLGELIDVKHGFAFKGEYFRDEPPGDVLLTPGNFAIGGGFKYDKLKYYDGPVPEEYILDAGDLIVTMTDLSRNCDTLGYPAIVPRKSGSSRFLHNQRLGKIEVTAKYCLIPRFLFYFMCSREYRHEIVSGATGTTVRHTSPSRIKQVTALVPPPKDQEAIACILGALDDKIELNRKMNRTLEATTRAIFKSWFVDFDPVRAKAAGQQPSGLKPEISAFFPDAFEESEQGEIPTGWRISPIGDMVQVLGGGTPSTKVPAYWEGGTHPFCTPKDMSSVTEAVLLGTERHLTDEGLVKVSSGKLPIGTVLLSSRAPIGYLAVAETPVSVNQGIIAMVCDGELPNLYVLHWTRANMDRVLANANGSTFMEISKRNFRPITVVVPSRPVLRCFMQIVEPMHQRVVSSLRQIQHLADLRDSLLPRLISGELVVEEAERIAWRAL